MPCVQHVTIVGGGIGGLALALALEQRGIEVSVYESGLRWLPASALHRQFASLVRYDAFQIVPGGHESR